MRSVNELFGSYICRIVDGVPYVTLQIKSYFPLFTSLIRKENEESEYTGGLCGWVEGRYVGGSTYIAQIKPHLINSDYIPLYKNPYMLIHHGYPASPLSKHPIPPPQTKNTGISSLPTPPPSLPLPSLSLRFRLASDRSLIPRNTSSPLL